MHSLSQMFDQALHCHQAGNLGQAESLYRQILQIDPRHVNALHLFGLIAHQYGRSDLAVDCIQQALRLHPEFPAANNSLGMALRDLGRLDEAITSYQQALRLQPDFAEVYSNLGIALQDQGRLDEAIVNFQQAVRLKPDFAEAYSNLGNAQGDQRKLDDAAANCRQALRLKPGFAEAHSNLGNALKDQGKLDEAIASYQQALQFKPDYAEAYNNLGIALRDQGKLEEAMTSHRQALHLRPNYADAHLNLGLDLLRLGNFADGWAEYEWRWRSKSFLAKHFSRPPLSQMAWDGSPLQGRVVLLHAEQGLGDTIQFVRFARLVKERGADKVWLACPPELVRLMSRCPGIDQVFPGPPLPAFDIGAFLLSLPYVLGTTSAERIPANVPYLDCDPDLVEHWRLRLKERMGEGEKGRKGESNALSALPFSHSPLLPSSLSPSPSSVRVGITWQGNPANSRDRWRSVPLEQFAPLAQQAGVRLVSLQKSAGSEQLEKMPGLALNLDPELNDLADTAAVIRCLDLVITVDTAVAHLAGALGTPVWVALPKVPDWRWLMDREDSPWYPTMRLFRQTERGRWDDVFRRIKDALMAQAVTTVL